ncbi:DUF3375 domain-containing protein [Methylonatrum kenyense]|uniref:DUF3375 domain-containing protein n=1 Tax=Methylonatrum kenyense TaxID=455253 RepID=UPI0020BED5A8|nr:DUF3375 domain-containing protein [Methylonatrum kenyense]MCK8515011.1 DUF3375 domain-containing protein [Methylonatrum kenyense]
MEFKSLQSLRRLHPGWRLLQADNAPMIIAFFHRCFVKPNARALPASELENALEDYLYTLRIQVDAAVFPRAACEYLADWAANERGWLRKYYPQHSDEPHFDLTPATEQAIRWLTGLEQPHFIGAESRLTLVFDLLQQIVDGAETDPEARLRDLETRREAIEREIEDVRAGHLNLMDPTRLRERFLQMADTARGLLGDFRQVEANFRRLDRQVREQVATWEGGKGDVLDQVFGEHDRIADSDQGRSFRAFWDLLMSPSRQEELSELLARTLALAPVAELDPDPALGRIHYDWLAAGEHTQRVVARLSEQLRRYIDDQAWLENRRIMGLIRDLEQHALALRESPPRDLAMRLDEPAPRVELPMERPLYSPPMTPHIAQQVLEEGEADGDAGALFEQAFVDRALLQARIRQALQTREQVSLSGLLEQHPLEQGLAELVAYLALAADDHRSVIDESDQQTVYWHDRQGVPRSATLPRVIFSR